MDSMARSQVRLATPDKTQGFTMAPVPYVTSTTCTLTVPNGKMKESSWLADCKAGYGRISGWEKIKFIKKIGGCTKCSSFKHGRQTVSANKNAETNS